MAQILGLLIVASLLASLTKFAAWRAGTGDIAAYWLAFLVFGLIMWVTPEALK